MPPVGWLREEESGDKGELEVEERGNDVERELWACERGEKDGAGIGKREASRSEVSLLCALLLLLLLSLLLVILVVLLLIVEGL